MTSGFVGSVPAYYDRYLGPVLFEPYAGDLARRVPPTARRIVEIAAGTGRVTRHLVGRLLPDGELFATDLNAAMVDQGRAVVTDRRVHWRAADAQQLPFTDAAFDAAVCQFGLMFVPEPSRALAEIRRVVRPDGVALWSTWDAQEANGACHTIHELAVATLADPPQFYLAPFTLPDPEAVRALALAAGFTDVHVDHVVTTAVAESAASLATGLIHGNPFAQQIAERDVDVPAFERRLAAELAARFGDRPCESPLSAFVFTAR